MGGPICIVARPITGGNSDDVVFAVNTTSSLLPPVIGRATMHLGTPIHSRRAHLESELNIKHNFDVTS